MRPPEFWNYRDGRLSAPTLRTLLTPISWVWSAVTARRIRTTVPYECGVPVICVGNVTLGGTGKTPVTAYLLQSLTRMNIRAVGLSRGYKGQLKGPIPVSDTHTHRDVGDEPILLARNGVVWVSEGRDDGARAAVAHGAKVIVMDDGHQNPSLAKTLSLVVVDAQTGFGNGCVVPAGPLREPVKTSLARADAVILIKPYQSFEIPEDVMEDVEGQVILTAWLHPKSSAPSGKLFAFAGIGRPNKFFDALRQSGADLVEEIGYPDHHNYSPEDIKSLTELAKELGAQLITTEKDHVRLPKGFAQHVATWPIEVRFDDELMMRRLLHPIIEQVKP